MFVYNDFHFFCIFLIYFFRSALIDFSFTIKAATLIFISGRASAISSAKEETSGSFYKLIKNK